MTELILKEEVFEVIGAAMEVHATLGPGFLESVYAEAFALELSKRNISFAREVALRIRYKDQYLEKRFQADFLIQGQLLVELKALDRLSDIERAQVVNYLKAATLTVGLLINFGSPRKLEWERLVHQAPI